MSKESDGSSDSKVLIKIHKNKSIRMVCTPHTTIARSSFTNAEGEKKIVQIVFNKFSSINVLKSVGIIPEKNKTAHTKISPNKKSAKGSFISFHS